MQDRLSLSRNESSEGQGVPNGCVVDALGGFFEPEPYESRWEAEDAEQADGSGRVLRIEDAAAVAEVGETVEGSARPVLRNVTQLETRDGRLHDGACSDGSAMEIHVTLI
jgi:hypothetical protein